MNKYPITVGSVVISRLGRDEGRPFIVMREIDADFVEIADGKLRGMDRLKKKRRKHLKTTGIFIAEVPERMAQGPAIENHEVRSWLKREET